MPIERSAGAVVFRRVPKNSKGEILYLLLDYPGRRGGESHWDLSRGIIRKGEDPKEAAIREIREETGIDDLYFLEGFKEWVKFFFRWEGRTVMKIVTYFLAETSQAEVKLSSEHIGYAWLALDEALKRLTYQNPKYHNSIDVLKKAHAFLQKEISASQNKN